jgi:hypothetical protein
MPESKNTRLTSRRAAAPKKPKTKPAAAPAAEKPEWLMSTPATLYSLEAVSTNDATQPAQQIELTQDEYNALMDHLFRLRGFEASEAAHA